MNVRRISSYLAAAVLGVSLLTPALTRAASDETPMPVSARRALVTNISELKVDNIPMSKVITFLKDVSGANVVVNWKALEGAGIDKDTPISLDVRELSLRKMLRLVLDQASPTTLLVFGVDSNVIQITTQEDADKVMITKVYVVDDLVMPDNANITPPTMNLQDSTKGGTTTGGSGGGGSGVGTSSLFTEPGAGAGDQGGDTKEKRGQDLASLVREVVRPTIWRENGGTASIRYMNGKLIVTAPVSVHEAIGGPVLPEGGQRIGM